MHLKMRPAWAEIDLDLLAQNTREVCRLAAPSTLVMGIVKAGAYGHGAVRIAKTLTENGVNRLGVAILSEAIELRKAGCSIPILILGYTDPSQYAEVIDFGIEQTIFSYETAELLSEEARKRNHIAMIHIKIDTGMRRIGFEPDAKSVDLIMKIGKLKNLNIVGIFTHFVCADRKEKHITDEQYWKFLWVCNQLESAGLDIPIRHIANSAAIIDLPKMHLDMVRAGIMLYGLLPSVGSNRPVDIKPIMTLKAKIISVKRISKGENVGYGGTYFTDRPTVVATLPIGYADGYPRRLSGKGYALVQGEKVPIIGRICMDQCMADVTDVERVSVGAEAVLFGTQGNNRITIDELATIVGTINYEIVCGISRRVPRVYIENGIMIDYADYDIENDFRLNLKQNNRSGS